MDVFFFFLIAGVSIIVMILKFDKKQTIKVNAVLRESRSIPPMFLLKSTEQKIASLKAALRYDDVPVNMAAASTMANLYNNKNESLRLSKVQELKVLSAKYNNGQISIEAYNARLDELLDLVHQHSGDFVLAS
ncbi:MAG: hypothetical protein ACTHMI_24510 [Mucilaginibacter sp.]|uniref:hypothetical protein n=1 Tax=Mucilaginibacter sp. L3T2-6 TaxID=3062491 RepID=UPI002674CF74|nr:hypothetical protein [Mucilaginibacter sp. L3T2-6]MDO3644700.1 hypothetical protein [Mucilaginibacter sp. L3T2-6]MDV6217152.1 hypothetical protein [Mucilaginibacter sp. L3T2-6]